MKNKIIAIGIIILFFLGSFSAVGTNSNINNNIINEGELFYQKSYNQTNRDEVDQQQILDDQSVVLYTGSGRPQKVSQTFKPGLNTITRIEWRMRRFGNPPGNVIVEVRDNGYTGPVVTSVTVSASSLPTSKSWVEFDFPDESVDVDTTYALVLTYTGGDGDNYVEVYGTLTDAYSRGFYSNYIEGEWCDFTDCDLAFKTYGTELYSVLLDFDPYGTGSTINFNGVDYSYGTIAVSCGKYPIKVNAGQSYKFSHWTSSCGTLDNPNSDSTYLTVTSNGVLQVHLFEKQSPYYFIHMTDTHIKSGTAYEEINKRFEITLNYIRTYNPPPAFIVISGDLTDSGTLSELTVFKNYLYGNKGQFYLDEAKTIPVYLCPGNHDHLELAYPYAYNNIIGYPNENGKNCYKTDYGNTRIISIDSGGNVYWPGDWVPSWDFDNAFRMPEGDGLCPETITWLNNAMNIGLNKIIFMHHPAINYYSCWDDGCIRKNLNQFLTICKNNHVGLILSGHTHKSSVYQYKNNAKSKAQPPTDNENGHHYYLTYGIPSSYTRTLQIITPSVRDSFAFRKISVEDGDTIKVFYYNYAAKTSTGDLIWLTGGSKGDPPGIANLSIIGSSRAEIPGAYVINLTNLENNTFGKQASLLYGQDDYMFVIEGLREGSVDFNCRHFCGKSKGEIMTYYKDLPLKEGSIAKLYINKDSIDHTIYIDFDGDGKIDRFDEPDEIECINVPCIPDRPDGETKGKPRTTYSYTAQTEDPESDNILYMFDWGDGTQSDWLGPFKSNSECTASKQWAKRGTYNVRVRAKDIYGYVSEWSDPLEVNIRFLNSRSVYGGPFFNWLLNHFPILKNILILRNQ